MKNILTVILLTSFATMHGGLTKYLGNAMKVEDPAQKADLVAKLIVAGVPETSPLYKTAMSVPGVAKKVEELRGGLPSSVKDKVGSNPIEALATLLTAPGTAGEKVLVALKKPNKAKALYTAVVDALS